MNDPQTRIHHLECDLRKSMRANLTLQKEVLDREAEIIAHHGLLTQHGIAIAGEQPPEPECWQDGSYSTVETHLL